MSATWAWEIPSLEECRNTPLRNSGSKIHYDISLNKYLPWDSTLPARDQCEQGSNICMTVISERPDHRLEPPRTIYVVPVAGNFPDRQLNVTAKLAQKTDSMNHGTSAA
ncbi:ATG27 domain protein [Rhizoctonia solani 123E]|uniref:ATG27 domain protein n=1 Tax=Rhizoctonia solani 123E TaxID=1423351 RepID=A0A074RLD6_9AGAM|nr:ATG27 domain protein [Rhizoctonia solani 123E]